MQTRLQSFVESTVHVVIGWITGLLLQILLFYFYNIEVPFSTNLKLSIIFTLFALLRTFLIRRYFNNRIHNLAIRLTNE